MPNDITTEILDLTRLDHVAEAIELIALFAEELNAPLDWPTRAALPNLLIRRDATVLLARHDGNAVGIVVGQRTILTFKGSEAFNIHDFFVAKEFRGAGVGRLLMEKAVAFARSLGCVRITLEVDTENTNARNFYQASGFELPEDEGKELHFIRLPLE